MTPHKNTHKNKAITAFFNRFSFICLIASTAMLTACIGKESAESQHDFSSRTFVLDGNFSLEASTANDTEANAVAFRYLERIGFQGYERAGRVFGTVIRGDFDGNSERLDAEDGFLIVRTAGEGGDGGHVFAGRFENTNVGAELTETPPVAIFSGRAHVVVVHARGGGLFSGGNSIISEIRFANLDLAVNFDDKTLIGEDSNGLGTLNVNGRFNEQTLSGTVTTTFTNRDVISAASRNDFTANLDGRIGADGAVGVFNNHLARGRPSDYALGGGFVVKPPPSAN